MEEIPNRNCFGISSVIFLCAMVNGRGRFADRLLEVTQGPSSRAQVAWLCSAGCERARSKCIGNIRIHFQLRPEGRNRRGETRLRGPEEIWGPSEASEFDPSFQQFVVSEPPPPRGTLEPRKGSQRPRRGSSGASERCVRSQQSGKTRWATQRPLRGPIFPDAP